VFGEMAVPRGLPASFFGRACAGRPVIWCRCCCPNVRGSFGWRGRTSGPSNRETMLELRKPMGVSGPLGWQQLSGATDSFVEQSLEVENRRRRMQITRKRGMYGLGPGRYRTVWVRPRRAGRSRFRGSSPGSRCDVGVSGCLGVTISVETPRRESRSNQLVQVRLGSMTVRVRPCCRRRRCSSL